MAWYPRLRHVVAEEEKAAPKPAPVAVEKAPATLKAPAALSGSDANGTSVGQGRWRPPRTPAPVEGDLGKSIAPERNARQPDRQAARDEARDARSEAPGTSQPAGKDDDLDWAPELSAQVLRNSKAAAVAIKAATGQARKESGYQGNRGRGRGKGVAPAETSSQAAKARGRGASPAQPDETRSWSDKGATSYGARGKGAGGRGRAAGRWGEAIGAGSPGSTAGSPAGGGTTVSSSQRKVFYNRDELEQVATLPDSSGKSRGSGSKGKGRSRGSGEARWVPKS